MPSRKNSHRNCDFVHLVSLRLRGELLVYERIAIRKDQGSENLKIQDRLPCLNIPHVGPKKQPENFLETGLFFLAKGIRIHYTSPVLHNRRFVRRSAPVCIAEDRCRAQWAEALAVLFQPLTR